MKNTRKLWGSLASSLVMFASFTGGANAAVTVGALVTGSTATTTTVQFTFTGSIDASDPGDSNANFLFIDAGNGALASLLGAANQDFSVGGGNMTANSVELTQLVPTTLRTLAGAELRESATYVRIGFNFGSATEIGDVFDPAVLDIVSLTFDTSAPLTTTQFDGLTVTRGVFGTAVGTTVPEPTSALLLGLGAIALTATRRRK